MDTLFIPVIMFLLNFIIYSVPLIATYMTLDAFYIAGNFFISSINGKNDKEIVKTQNIYILSTTDRYIWYIFCSIIYQIIIVLFWTKHIMIINIIFYSINIPYIQNKLIEHVFSELFEEIHSKKVNFIKNNIVKQSVKITNAVIKTYANRTDNLVTSEDINYLLKNYDDTISYAKTIMQNIIVLYSLHFFKSYGDRFQSIIRKLYNFYYSDKKIVSTDAIDLKIMLNDICDNKDWKKLLDPTFIKLMLNIYYNATLDKENNILLIAKNQILYSTSKFCAIWTLKSLIVSCLLKLDVTYLKELATEEYHNTCEQTIFIDIIDIFDYGLKLLHQIQIIYIPFIYILFHIYKYGIKPVWSIEYIAKILGIITGIFMGLFINSDFLICFISEFFYYILLNPFVVEIGKAIYVGIINFVINNRKLSNYQINTIILSSISCIAINWVIIRDCDFLYERLMLFTTALSISAGYCSVKNIWNIMPLIVVLNISAQSYFNPIHIMACIPNVFILMNYLNSEMFLNMIFKLSYMCDYKLDKIIKGISNYIPDYELIVPDDINSKSVIINNDQNPILIESFF